MSLFGGLKISASALSVERLRMNVIAENIANAESTRTPEGGAYRRKQIIVAEGAADVGGGVRAVGIVADPSPSKLLFDPSHPDARADGYVQMPNVDVPAETVDLMTATRAYEANAAAYQTQRQSQERTLELLV